MSAKKITIIIEAFYEPEPEPEPVLELSPWENENLRELEAAESDNETEREAAWPFWENEEHDERNPESMFMDPEDEWVEMLEWITNFGVGFMYQSLLADPTHPRCGPKGYGIRSDLTTPPPPPDFDKGYRALWWWIKHYARRFFAIKDKEMNDRLRAKGLLTDSEDEEEEQEQEEEEEGGPEEIPLPPTKKSKKNKKIQKGG